MKIIDAHTHIDFISPNVDGAICCATKESDWQKIIGLTKTDNRVYGAFGVHPWFIDNIQNDFESRLEELLNVDAKYMVGEIGLDKYKPDMDKQINIFIKQFNIAIKLKRIVCLHCVGAWDKILHILKTYKKSLLPTIIVHAFDENEDILQKLLKYENIVFSISKNAVYDRNYRIARIPNDKILVETDGDKNVSLECVINEISKIKNESNMWEIIYNNTKRVLQNG
jgi:TatD DNase family protein